MPVQQRRAQVADDIRDREAEEVRAVSVVVIVHHWPPILPVT